MIYDHDHILHCPPSVAAEKAAEELAKKALKLGYGSAAVKLKVWGGMGKCGGVWGRKEGCTSPTCVLQGVGNNKQYVVQSLAAAGMQLTRLMDVTPIPYNGCRRPKRRRV